MASFKPKYKSLEQEPITTAPSESAARLPDPVENPKPIEPPTSANPVRDAEQAEISKRLAEMEQAKEMAAAPQPQPPPQADDPEQEERLDQFRHQLEQAIAPLPEEAKPWFRRNPEYIFDAEKSAAANHFHNVTRREIGEEFTPRYFERMETHLGLRQPKPRPRPAAPARPAGPSVGYAAPSSREAPSLSTGRPMSESTVRLTDQERADARMWGLTDQQMLEGKQRLVREKSAGMHQNG